jgi:hypothetical protein
MNPSPCRTVIRWGIFYVKIKCKKRCGMDFQKGHTFVRTRIKNDSLNTEGVVNKLR